MSGAIDHALCLEMAIYMESLTTSGKPTLNEETFKKFKKICKKSDEYVKHAYHLIMTQLSKEHSEIRLSALQMSHELFMRSHCFRDLLLAEFQMFMELCIETSADYPLPPPKAAAKALRCQALEAVQKWFEKFGGTYKKLSLGYHFLKDCKKIQFQDIQDRSNSERQMAEERQRRIEAVKKTKLDLVLKELTERKVEIKDTLLELENVLKLLLPEPENFQVPGLMSPSPHTLMSPAPHGLMTPSRYGLKSPLQDSTATSPSHTNHDSDDPFANWMTDDEDDTNTDKSPSKTTDKGESPKQVSSKVKKESDGDSIKDGANKCEPDGSHDNRTFGTNLKAGSIKNSSTKPSSCVVMDEDLSITNTSNQSTRSLSKRDLENSATTSPEKSTLTQKVCLSKTDLGNVVVTNSDNKRTTPQKSSKFDKQHDKKKSKDVKEKLKDVQPHSKDGSDEEFHEISEEEDESDEEDEFEDFDEDYFVSSSQQPDHIRELGFGSQKYTVDIRLRAGPFVIEETEDNSELLDTLNDATALIKRTYLPDVLRWLDIMTKAGAGQEHVKKVLDIKAALQKAEEKVATVCVKRMQRKSNAMAHDEEDDDDSDDFEEVAEKEGYEDDIPEELKRETGMMATVAMAAAARATAAANAAATAHTAATKRNLDSEKCHDWLPLPYTVEDDPTSWASTFKRMKQQQSLGRPSAAAGAPPPQPGPSFSAPGPSTSTITNPLKEKAPVIPYGTDLMYWGKDISDSDVPLKVSYHAEHRFWTPKGDKDIVDGEALAAMKSRVMSFTGKFEPVKWKCRAPMKDGKLCQRMDRVKCPFHGCIIPRDDLGQPTRPEDKARMAAQEHIRGDVVEWEDPEFQAELSAATGIDLTRGKGKGKGGKGKKKKKYPELTDINSHKNTSRSRLERKVMSRNALSRIGAKLDSIDKKRHNDKFGNQFNYSYALGCMHKQ